jgi:serine protease Do
LIDRSGENAKSVNGFGMVLAGVWRLRTALAGLVALAIFVPGGASAFSDPSGFADLAAKVTPAVVNIATKQNLKPERATPMPDLPPGSPFEKFFKDFLDRNKGDHPEQPRTVTSLGSGFIIDPKGYIVTNNHVIDGADEITVVLADQKEYKATIVGHDSDTDLALLKIDADKDLPSVPLGDSDKPRVGDWVMAVGNPFGIGESVSVGIVSARNRDLQSGNFDDFIQTDAAINKGNSGGPLFNMAGEVIGINTAIYSPNGSSVGVGFATPTNLAKKVLADFRQFGHIQRGWLGVRLQTVTPEIAESLGLKEPSGALVAEVMPGSPAKSAGIETSDVVLEFDGKTVDEMRTLPRVVLETPIGKKVDVKVWRNGKTKDIPVNVGRFVEPKVASVEPAPSPVLPVGKSIMGMNLATLTPLLRERFEVKPETSGVAVLDVDPAGRAAEKGIRPGDIILEVDRQKVASPADIEARMKAAKGGRKAVLLLINRNNQNVHIALPSEG